MGQRANLILVESGRYRVFYSHWCAASMTQDFFWGPEYAAIFVKAQEPVEDGHLLDEIWAEGGAVLDRDAKTLLMFGGEDEMYQVPIRRLYLALLKCVWKDWVVEWADEGVADLADRIGYPRAKVLRRDREEPTKLVLEPRTLSGWASTVGSARMRDGSIRLYPLMALPFDYPLAGHRLLHAVEKYPGVCPLKLDESTDHHPSGGFHLDLIEKVVEFWIARPTAEAQERVACCWPDWTVQWHRDRFEFQLERAGGLLRFPACPRCKLLERIRASLMYEEEGSMLDEIMRMVKEGRFVEVNPHALREANLIVPQEERARIIDAAIAAMGDER